MSWDRIFGVFMQEFLGVYGELLYILCFQGNLRVRCRVLEVLTEKFLNIIWKSWGNLGVVVGIFVHFTLSGEF